MNKIKLHISVVMMAVMLAMISMWGCGSPSYNATLVRIADLVDGTPELALDLLSALDTVNLGEADRHYRDFLDVKAHDKAYYHHRSDSLILSVLSYYEKGRDRGLYPEVLYYCGRVYSDLGDYPTALRYYQSALDELPEDADPYLRRRMLSQTGRLLNTIRLYNQAIPYLKESLELSETVCDRDMIHYDYQLLGTVYVHNNEYEKADSCYRMELNVARQYDDTEVAAAEGYIASLKLAIGEIDSAAIYIHGVPERVHKADRDHMSYLAANIYKDANKWDLAYHYASNIIHSGYPGYRIAGYKILLAPEIRPYLDPDSVDVYLNRCISSVDNHFNEHDAEAAIMQNSMYNYSLHERRSAMLYKSRSRMMMWLIIVLVICFVISLGLLLSRRIIISKNKLLSKAQVTIKALNRRMYDNAGGDSSALPPTPEPEIVKEEDLSEATKEMDKLIYAEIESLKTRLMLEPELPAQGKDTAGYRKVIEALDNDRVLNPDDSIWETVRESVLSISPSFESTLRRLSLNRLKREDLQLAYLLRLGISSARVADLIGRDKASVTYRRRRLCETAFHKKIEVARLDKILLLI